MLFWHSKKFEKILRKTIEGFEIRNYEIFESYNMSNLDTLVEALTLKSTPSNRIAKFCESIWDFQQACNQIDQNWFQSNHQIEFLKCKKSNLKSWNQDGQKIEFQIKIQIEFSHKNQFEIDSPNRFAGKTRLESRFSNQKSLKSGWNRIQNSDSNRFFSKSIWRKIAIRFEGSGSRLESNRSTKSSWKLQIESRF